MLEFVQVDTDSVVRRPVKNVFLCKDQRCTLYMLSSTIRVNILIFWDICRLAHLDFRGVS